MAKLNGIGSGARAQKEAADGVLVKVHVLCWDGMDSTFSACQAKVRNLHWP